MWILGGSRRCDPGQGGDPGGVAPGDREAFLAIRLKAIRATGGLALDDSTVGGELPNDGQR